MAEIFLYIFLVRLLLTNDFFFGGRVLKKNLFLMRMRDLF